KASARQGATVPRGSIAVAGDAKTEIVAREIRHVRIPGSRPQSVEARFPAPAAVAAPRAGGWAAWIDLWYRCVCAVVIEAPFPDVAGHVFNPKGAGAKWKGADR